MCTQWHTLSYCKGIGTLRKSWYVISWYVLTIMSSLQYWTCNDTFLGHIPQDYTFVTGLLSTLKSYSTDLSKTCKAETAWWMSGEKCDSILNEIVALELKLGISRRCQPADAEYIKINQYINKWKYHCPLDALQRLVVQHLFELNKLNIAATGICTSTITIHD